MMDKYIDHFFSSSSWSDVNAKERSSWACMETDQPNELLPDSLGVQDDEENNSSVSMISSNHSMERLGAPNASSSFLGGESDYVVCKGLISEESGLRKCGQNGNGNHSVNTMMNGITNTDLDLQYNSAIPSLSSLNQDSIKLLPFVGAVAPSFPFNESVNMGCNGSELLGSGRSFRNLQTLSPASQLWSSPSYEDISSLSSVMREDGIQSLCPEGENVDNDVGYMGNRYVSLDEILQLNSLYASIATKGCQGLPEFQKFPLSSFDDGPQMPMTTVGLLSLPQNKSATPTGACNGTGKPRVRARRGQATDPHSIAERLRREKISERMKNLQELVPNSNKTDKASMLDEIIDYVKFLQLQVKVLSMSRLGAAGAVVPLITDGQSEGANDLSLSPSPVQGVDVSPSPNQTAFEQEVVKLMESNITMAMQYLQSKGLCLMPVALASAISSGKASTPSSGLDERKKSGFISNGLIHNNNTCSSSSSSSFSLPGVSPHQTSTDANNTLTAKLSRAGIMNKCRHGVVKNEEMKKNPSNAA